MRKFTLLATLLIFSSFLSLTSNAQTVGNLWGTTSQGGDSNTGALFCYAPLSNSDSINVPFSPNDINQPQYAKLVQDASGNFYGMAYTGGQYGNGGIFKWSPSGHERVIHSFNGGNTDGANPEGNLIIGQDGMLYGMAQYGGPANQGVIFKCSTDGSVFDTLHTFGTMYNGNDGEQPQGDLVQAANGTLYGMTYTDGNNSSGVIFKCSPTGSWYDTIHAFGNQINGAWSDGYYPYGNLIIGKDGMLYGMTESGGANGFGMIFKCDTTGAVYDSVHCFGKLAYDGENPYGSLVQAANGTLYGMTYSDVANGNGVIFKCSPDGSKYDTLHAFGLRYGGNDGYNPYGSLVFGADSMLYGMTYYGGFNGRGTIFKCDTNNGTGYDTLYSLGYKTPDGANPYGSLIFGHDDNLYGMTSSGGTPGNGTIVEYNMTGGTESLAYTFGSNILGSMPQGDFIQGKDGNLYGVASAGGAYADGTIDKYNPATGVLSLLYTFTGNNDGSSPSGSLTMDATGNFYGIAQNGGVNGLGDIYKITPSGSFTVIHSFAGLPGDGYPINNNSIENNSLIVGKDGMLYGVTTQGGVKNYGVIFKCSTDGSVFDTIHSFLGWDGVEPGGSLVQAKNGTLYGMTTFSGHQNGGTIFKCATDGSRFDTLRSFVQTGPPDDVDQPIASLIIGADSMLYGMSPNGHGAYSQGGIFKIDTAGGNYTLLHGFTGGPSDGTRPQGNLMQASNGTFYGLTQNGGANNIGSLFEMNSSGTETIDFSFATPLPGGAFPSAELTEIMSASVAQNITCSGTVLTSAVRGYVGSLSYSWSNGSTNAFDTVKTAGTYSLTVTDSRGISYTVPVTTTYDTLSVNTSNAAICNGSTANLTATGNGGAPSLTYTWMPGTLSGSSQSVTPSSTTVYTVTVSDGMGCKDSAKATVTVNSLPTVSVNVTSTAVCAGVNDTLIANASGNGSFSYSWNTGATSDTLITTAAGTYTVTVTDKNNCTQTNNGTVTVNPLPTVNVTGKDTINAGVTDTLVATGGVSYVWTGGGSKDTNMVSPLNTTTYTVTATGANGCSDTASFKVVVNISTGIVSTSTSASTSVYPNPVINTVNLSFKVLTATEGRLEVCDAGGKVISTSTETLSNGKTLHMDVTNLAQGMYFVRVVTGNQVQVIKFIKQ